MSKNITYEQKLKECLCKAFFLDCTKYMNFQLMIVERYSNKCGGEYLNNKNMLVVQKDESGCNELLFATMLHELSHHVEYVQRGYTKHDRTFLSIQQRLLCAAFDLRYLEPSKLALAEEFLSKYTERKHIKELCLKYMEERRMQIRFEIVFACKKTIGYKYSPVIECWYKFERLQKAEKGESKKRT